MRTEAELEAMDKSELPTRTVRGKLRPVHEDNYKRKEAKKIRIACKKRLLDEFIAAAVVAGYENAGGLIQHGRLVVYPEGLPVGEEV